MEPEPSGRWARRLVDRVDKRAKRLGTTRSGFTRAALRAALERYDEAELEERHRAGYVERARPCNRSSTSRRRIMHGVTARGKTSDAARRDTLVPLCSSGQATPGSRTDARLRRLMASLGEVTVAPVTTTVRGIQLEPGQAVSDYIRGTQRGRIFVGANAPSQPCHRGPQQALVFQRLPPRGQQRLLQVRDSRDRATASPTSTSTSSPRERWNG